MSYPKKEAQTAAPIVDVIRDRWSPVIFSHEPVSDAHIASLFEAARWAPSSFNEQPWIYVYAKFGDPKRAALDGLLVEGNAWAKDAGLLILSFTRKNFTHHERPNYHHMHDLGAASGYLVLQATALGLISHQMEGFDKSKANAVAGVPDAYVPGSMIAIGHAGDQATASPDALKRDASPRTRKPREQFAFEGVWKG